MLHSDTLYDHRNVIIDGKQFGTSIAWRLSWRSTFCSERWWACLAVQLQNANVKRHKSNVKLGEQKIF